MKTINLIQLKKTQSDFPSVQIKNSKEAADFIRQFYSDDIEIFESAFVLLLNRASKTIAYAKISQGGVTGTVIDPKIVLKYAIDSLASGIILAHNHPSGNLSPSKSDIDITVKIREAAKLCDIILSDHIILTADSYYSLADNGLL